MSEKKRLIQEAQTGYQRTRLVTSCRVLSDIQGQRELSIFELNNVFLQTHIISQELQLFKYPSFDFDTCRQLKIRFTPGLGLEVFK